MFGYKTDYVRVKVLIILCTNADIVSNSANITIGNVILLENGFQLGVTMFLIIKKGRIGVNIRLVPFMNYGSAICNLGV